MLYITIRIKNIQLDDVRRQSMPSSSNVILAVNGTNKIYSSALRIRVQHLNYIRKISES